MFSKNLKYFRLSKAYTKKELAAKVNVSSMAITNYENGTRKPNMDILKKMALALDVKVSDFLTVRNENLNFTHGEFRKNAALSIGQQEYIKEAVEEYFNRFLSVVEILGGDVLPKAPECHVLPIQNNVELNAQLLRKHLNLASDGPIDNLIEVLENKGILVYVCEIENDQFSGMNGFVNQIPYIVLNSNMTAERKRSTIAHELAHLMFAWPDDLTDKAIEKTATSISGAFLFPEKDALRELGIHRTTISKDMVLVAKEYGISMMLLVKRAFLSNIISENVEKSFYIKASHIGWRIDEPSRIADEFPTLFDQLVYRAINEKEISMQRGAELLKTPYNEIVDRCCFTED